MATSYDYRVYPEAGRWHFEILRLMEGRAGASSAVFISHAETRQGYATKEEATKAALAQKANFPTD